MQNYRRYLVGHFRPLRHILQPATACRAQFINVKVFVALLFAVHLTACWKEGDIRLVGGPEPRIGTVLIYHSGFWGTVCKRGWGLIDAVVVCRQLGYPGTLGAIRNGRYGKASDFVWMSNVNCRGDENRLLACIHSPWTVNTCRGSIVSAGVKCRRKRHRQRIRAGGVTQKPQYEFTHINTPTASNIIATKHKLAGSSFNKLLLINSFDNKINETTKKLKTTYMPGARTLNDAQELSKLMTTDISRRAKFVHSKNFTLSEVAIPKINTGSTDSLQYNVTLRNLIPMNSENQFSKKGQSINSQTLLALSQRKNTIKTNTTASTLVDKIYTDLSRNAISNKNRNTLRPAFKLSKHTNIEILQNTTVSPYPLISAPRKLLSPITRSASSTANIYNLSTISRLKLRANLAKSPERELLSLNSSDLKAVRIRPDNENTSAVLTSNGSMILYMSVNRTRSNFSTFLQQDGFNHLPNTVFETIDDTRKNVDKNIHYKIKIDQHRDEYVRPHFIEDRMLLLQDEPFKITEVRLFGGRFATEGMVQVNIAGHNSWGNICGDHWSVVEATVVCKELGHGYAGSASKVDYYRGRDIDKYLYSVTCTGKEKNLSDCAIVTISSRSVCSKTASVAGLICALTLPDLVPDVGLVVRSAHLADKHLYYMQCAMEENCVASSAYELKKTDAWIHNVRRLLRFSSIIHNRGTADFRPFASKEAWQWHSCHMHYHSMDVFAHYDVIDVHGNRVAEGHKSSFCLEDSRCDRGVKKRYSCEGLADQGISPNCSDDYLHSVDCQWVDVTDVPVGEYLLRIEVNPSRKVAELNYDNNAVECKIEITSIKLITHNCTGGE